MSNLQQLEGAVEIENFESTKLFQKISEDIKLKLPTNLQALHDLYENLGLFIPDNVDLFGKRTDLAKQIALNNELKIKLENFLNNPLEASKSTGNSEEADFYTPAQLDLIYARQYIISKQFDTKKKYIEKLELYVSTHSIADQIKQRRCLLSNLSEYSMISSETGSTRPISAIKLYNDDQLYFTTWNGEVKSYDIKTGEIEMLYEHPGKISGLDICNNMLVTGSTDNNINFRKLGETYYQTKVLKGHTGRVSKVKFLSNFNEYFISASYDKTWKLWNVEHSIEDYMTQEGHTSEIASISTNRYGSLVCSGSLDGVGLVWDLRSGNKVTEIQHAKAIHCSDWCWNDTLVTGSADGTVQVWDLRKADKAAYIIPAHTSVVTDLKIDEDDQYMVSTSFDKNINVYSCGNWLKSSTLEGNMDKVLCVDYNESKIITGGWDRCVKVWSK